MTPPSHVLKGSVEPHEREVKDMGTSNPGMATTVTIDELKTDILAAVGKWALTIIASIVATTIFALSQWYAVVNRVERLETWKAERTKPIEDYYADQRANGERMARIESKLDALTDEIKRK